MKLHEITIENFKNVKYGKIVIPEKPCGQGASMLGIYGQNGTGKTAVIDALAIFNQLVQGNPIPERAAGYIRDNQTARFTLSFVFDNSNTKHKYTVEYEILFHAESHEDNILTFNPDSRVSLSCIIDSERLRFSCIDEEGNKVRMHDAGCASRNKGVWPKSFLHALESCRDTPWHDKEIKELKRIASFNKQLSSYVQAQLEDHSSLKDLEAAEKETQVLLKLLETQKDELQNAPIDDYCLCHREGRSYLFQALIRELMSQQRGEKHDLAIVYEAVANQSIVISGIQDEGQLSLDILPFYTMRDPLNSTRIIRDSSLRDSSPADESISKDKSSPIIAELQLDPRETFGIDEADLETINRTLPFLNIIIGSIIPGLSIEAYSWSPDPDGIADMQWYAIRKASEGEAYKIPLANESRGVQKIVSWAMLLVRVYNDSDFIAVIDEIDAGIFEYLLGEILSIIESEGRGQLIFTSHNLRPLEMLDKTSVVFTTTNPENRYLRLKNVKATNNLRDMYFRAITLDTQDESLYDFVSRARLGSAFSRAYQDDGQYSDETLLNVIIAQQIQDNTPLNEEGIDTIRRTLGSINLKEGVRP